MVLMGGKSMETILLYRFFFASNSLWKGVMILNYVIYLFMLVQWFTNEMRFLLQLYIWLMYIFWYLRNDLWIYIFGGFWILFWKLFVGLQNKMDFNDFGFKICGTNFIIWISLVVSYGNGIYGFELAIYKYTSIILLTY